MNSTFHKKLWLLLFALFTILLLPAQKLSKQDLITDLQFLDEAIINGHGINYDFNYKSKLPKFIDSIASVPGDSIDRIGYYLAVAAANYHIGCAHTYIKKAPFLKS